MLIHNIYIIFKSKNIYIKYIILIKKHKAFTI